MKSLPGLVTLALTLLLRAHRMLRQWLRVDAPRAGVLVPVRIRAERPPLRLPPPGASRRD